MLVLIVGEYKSGKTISAATFPKPMLFLDFDDGFQSVKTTRTKAGDLLIQEQDKIEVVSFYKKNVYPLQFITDVGSKNPPLHTLNSPALMQTFNEIIQGLAKDGCYKEKGPYLTLVIDSLTNFFLLWKEVTLRMNNISTLRIPDYGTFESVLFGQFIPSLKTILATAKLEHIILTDHIDSDKNEITGEISRFPVGPSRPLGQKLGLFFDEIWLQEFQAGNYQWRTKRQGLLNVGTRNNLPEVINPASWQELQKVLINQKKGG